MKISVSFKESEMEIYNYLKSQLSMSIYIKQLIIDDMKKYNCKPTKKEEVKNSMSISWQD
ncbi:hypothetical protein [Clostridium nigeriense]|uniref:hypothetical protein n=1 Tax=Clostridium nigeriense TaxID=1805470 RepID=UPI000829FBE6|nr:hypothetical protein [Clostridium nigeriense]